MGTTNKKRVTVNYSMGYDSSLQQILAYGTHTAAGPGDVGVANGAELK